VINSVYKFSFIQLQLLAEQGSLQPITSDYQPMAENEDTLRCYFRNHKPTFRISFAMQLGIYVVAIVTSPLLIFYLLYDRRFLLERKTVKILNESKNNTTDYKWCEERFFLHFIAVSSIVIWLYALLMSIAGLSYQQGKLSKALMKIHHKEHEGFNLMYALTPLIFAENCFTLCVSLIVFLIALMKYLSKGQKSNKSVVIELKEFDTTNYPSCQGTYTANSRTNSAPAILTADPSIQETNTASSTTNSAPAILDPTVQETNTASSTTNSESQISFHPRLAEYFFLFFPITTLAVHFTHIVIGFIQNPAHATSAGLFYSIVFLASVVLYKIISSVYLTCLKLKEKDSEFKKFWIHEVIFTTIFTILLLVMAGLFAFIASLYFLLPINRAVDIAPTVLNGFVSSVTLIFAGYIAYHFASKGKEKKSRSIP